MRFKHSFRLGLGAALLCATAWALADTTYPGWWLDYDVVSAQPPPISNPTAYNAWVRTNYSPVNVGQLKNFTAQAQAYLDTELASIGGAGPDIGNLVANFTIDSADNFAPVNLGQIKAAAAPIYDRLHAIGFNASVNLTANYGFSGNWAAYPYPWPKPPPADGEDGYNPTTYNTWVAQNYLLANLGQLKAVFSFDLGNFTPAANLSIAGDGIPDWWKVLNGLDPFAGNIALHYDFGDGRTDLQHYQFDENAYNGTVGNLTGFQSYYTTASTTYVSVPADYTSGNLDFPRQPAPQYALLDLGNYGLYGIDDDNEIMLFNDEGLTLWSAGNYTPVPPGAGNYTFSWYAFARNGILFGSYAEGGWVALDPLGETAYLTANDALDYVPGYATDYWLEYKAYDQTTDTAYFLLGYTYDVEIGEYENPNDPEDPLNGTPLYATNTDVIPMQWDDSNELTPVLDGDDEIVVLTSGMINEDMSEATRDFSFTYATNPQGDAITITYHYVYGEGYPDEFDNSYWAAFVDHLTLKLNGVEANDIGAYFLSHVGTAICPTWDGHSVYYLSGNSVVSANLPGGGNTALQFKYINNDGAGVTLGGDLWLNGALLHSADILPETALEDDALTLNLTALGIEANYTTPKLTLSTLAPNSLLAFGEIGDAANAEAPPHAVIAVPIYLGVDNNRDGSISLDIDDQTTSERPFRFWLNDDDDTGASDFAFAETVPVYLPNYESDWILAERDLEDFARLWLNIGAYQSAVSSGNIRVGLKWKPGYNGSPAIKLFAACEPDGGSLYLTDSATASLQVSNVSFNGALTDVSGVADDFAIVAPVTSGNHDYDFVFDPSVFANLTANNSTVHLLFEACSSGNYNYGKGELEVVFLAYNTTTETYTKLGNGPSVCLDLRSIKEMYQRVEVTPRDPSGIPKPYLSTHTFNEHIAGVEVPVDTAYAPPRAESNTIVVFVPGSNIDYDDSVNQAETMFKRLYWQGYNGRFAMFYWDTLVGPFDGLFPAEYDLNEYRAWKYGLALKNYVDRLPSRFSANKNVISHSLGAGVVVSALHEGMSVKNVILMQAAMPASCFDTSIETNDTLAAKEVLTPTPEAIADMGYKGVVSSNISANIYNIYNFDDYALTAWIANQEVAKPENLLNPVIRDLRLYTWSSPTGGSLWEHDAIFPDIFLRHVSDVHESISFISRSRTEALGVLSANGSVHDNLDVGQTSPSGFYNERYDHSGEFTHPIQQLQDFYQYIYFKITAP